jgi:hypothetical protein
VNNATHTKRVTVAFVLFSRPAQTHLVAQLFVSIKYINQISQTTSLEHSVRLPLVGPFPLAALIAQLSLTHVYPVELYISSHVG